MRKHRLASRLTALAAAWLLAGWPTPAGADEPTAPAPEGTAVYKFGVMPWQKGQFEDDIRTLYAPLVAHLGKELNCSFQLVTAKNYEQMIDTFVEGRVQIVNISPVPYITAQARNPAIQLVATELSRGEDGTARDYYIGHIIALKSREDIKSLKDLQGKAFGFVSEESSSGFKFPKALLAEQGMDYKTFFASHTFLGSHPRVTDALVSGSVDAGATWDFNLKQAVAKHGDVFKNLYDSPPIPNLCIAAHPSFPTELRAKLKAVLLKVDAALLQGLPAVGYVERPDEFYDVVRVVAGVPKIGQADAATPAPPGTEKN